MEYEILKHQNGTRLPQTITKWLSGKAQATWVWFSESLANEPGKPETVGSLEHVE